MFYVTVKTTLHKLKEYTLDPCLAYYSMAFLSPTRWFVLNF